MKIVNESSQAALDMLQLMLKRNGSTMEELMEVRNTIEIRTTKLAATHATTSDIEEMGRYVEIMQNNMTSLDEYVEADMNFHHAVAKASHNMIFDFMLKTIRPLFEEMIYETLKFEHRPELSMKYHEKIFDSIKAKDPDNAVKAIREHLMATEAMLNQSN